MTRLILALLLLGAAVIAVQVVTDAVRPRPLPRRQPRLSAATMEGVMPETIRTIAYVLLFVLALGVTSGLLGSA
jgi:hypothetical protein